MSTPSLDFLSGMTQAFVAKAAGDPVDPGILEQYDIPKDPFGKTISDNIAGIDTAHKNETEIQEGAWQYQSDQQFLERKLAAAGISALAFVPTNIWKKLCLEAKLYSFSPKDGSVMISNSIIKQAEKEIEDEIDGVNNRRMETYIPTCCLFWLCMCIGTVSKFWPAFIDWYTTTDIVVFLLQVIILLAVIGMIALIVSCILWETFIQKDRIHIDQKVINNHVVSLVARYTKEGTLFRHLWPGYSEPTKGARIHIALPEAPQDVQETLVKTKANGFAMHVATVEEAIGLLEDVTSVLIQAERQAQEAARLSAQRDPIVFIEHNGATAIIAQFGDFPIERAMMHEVLTAHYTS